MLVNVADYSRRALAATRKRHAHRLALAEDSDSVSERTVGDSHGDMHPARRPS
jgi:hypothetical protein